MPSDTVYNPSISPFFQRERKAMKQEESSRPSAGPFSPPGMTRRGFVTATLAAGFAFAVRPVSAATITTDETGLTTGEIRIRTTDGHIPAYRAKPQTGRAF